MPIRDETPETAIPSFPEGVPGAPAHRASFPGGRGARGGGPGGGWGGWRGKHLSRAFAPPFLTSHPFAENLGKVREKSPLILCLTNFVTVADCANALLAIGASPVMSLSPEDAGEIAAFAAGVVLNIGTLNDETLASMKKAAEIARARKIPVILDPAGVGATSVRKKAALWLAEIAKPAVIRGNSQEILALAGTLGQRQKGVDSDSAQNLGELAETAKTLAKTTGAVIGATGETDVVANAKEVIFLKGGSPLMTKLTGTGCVLSAVVGAFVGARPQNPLDAAASAMSFLKLAGERAEKALSPPGALGELKARLHDALSLIR
ncbi:MAG: hydroxyethylthiazole kinase [Deltaproteobacteria bacterium]|nr:hydroxyethylthiazole kinase [Deltaproteobacteria bacterium]